MRFKFLNFRIRLSLLLLFLLYLLWVAGQVGNHPSKIWLHRTNSMEKLEEKEGRFPNFEVDVVFRPDGTFDVTHDADTTFHLGIEPFLADVARDGDRMWMDLKNLSPANSGTVLSCLEELCGIYGVKKGQLIVESRNLNALAKFTAAGYYTSYYVDFEKPSEMEQAEQDTCLAHLRRVADSRKVCALSFPGWWYAPIKEGLGRSIDLLTWKHRTTEYELLALPWNRKLLNDPQVKVVLVKSKGSYHR